MGIVRAIRSSRLAFASPPSGYLLIGPELGPHDVEPLPLGVCVRRACHHIGPEVACVVRIVVGRLTDVLLFGLVSGRTAMIFLASVLARLVGF